MSYANPEQASRGALALSLSALIGGVRFTFARLDIDPHKPVNDRRVQLSRMLRSNLATARPARGLDAPAQGVLDELELVHSHSFILSRTPRSPRRVREPQLSFVPLLMSHKRSGKLAPAITQKTQFNGSMMPISRTPKAPECQQINASIAPDPVLMPRRPRDQILMSGNGALTGVALCRTGIGIGIMHWYPAHGPRAPDQRLRARELVWAAAGFWPTSISSCPALHRVQ